MAGSRQDQNAVSDDQTAGRQRPGTAAPQHGQSSNPHLEADAFVDQVSAALPPGLANAKSKSADEILKEMNRIPLFMTSLDEDEGDNELLEAIKAVAYEGTRAEVAQNFREQGNEAARAKMWPDAREFYTKAIQAVRGDVKTNEGVEEGEMKVMEEPDPEEEARKERAIEEACLSNRALCNLEMRNYRSCTRDCAATLLLNPKNVKAYYRAASACHALDKLAEAQDACATGLALDPANAALHSLRDRIASRQKTLSELDVQRHRRLEAAANRSATLRRALASRGIRTAETASPPEMEDAAISLADPDSETSALSLPLLLLYPLHAQTDLVKACGEDESLAAHLEYILPVPWDEAGEYRLDGVECYLETTAGGLIKAGKKLPLIKLLGSGKVTVVDGLVRVFVVPKARATEWIEQFKQRRGKQ